MAKGWDKRDYELWSAIQQLESFGLLPGDDRMISRAAVTKLLESHAEVRAAEPSQTEGKLNVLSADESLI